VIRKSDHKSVNREKKNRSIRIAVMVLMLLAPRCTRVPEEGNS
jgi:hypothetical protein